MTGPPAETPVVIALLVARADPAMIVPGSEQRPCRLCGRTVWIAPTSLRLGAIDINCLPCAVGRPDLADSTLELAPGALDEVRAATDEAGA